MSACPVCGDAPTSRLLPACGCYGDRPGTPMAAVGGFDWDPLIERIMAELPGAGQPCEPCGVTHALSCPKEPHHQERNWRR